jgi:hypothetical protein
VTKRTPVASGQWPVVAGNLLVLNKAMPAAPTGG